MKNRNRQRQRQSRKLIVLIGLSVTCLVLVFIVVVNLSHREAEAAVTGATSSNVVIVGDEAYPTSFEVSQQPVRAAMPVSGTAQLGHAVKTSSPNR